MSAIVKIKTRRRRIGPGRLTFSIVNYSFLAIVAFLCIVPMIHVLAVSFSGAAHAASGQVGLWPADFNITAYQYIISKPEFGRATWISVQRTVIGTLMSTFLTVLSAYPLSKEKSQFRARTPFVWIFYFTTMFSGGLIPTYLVIKELGMMDTIWALNVPGAVAVGNIVLVLNFFRRLPKEIEEAAFIDGASHWRILVQIVIPISKAVIATVVLFVMVSQWNEWFFGRIYMLRPANYPLQSYLRGLIAPDARGLELMTLEEQQLYFNVNSENSKAAQIFVAAFPIVITYPFLQKYFAKGIVIGSVKG